MAEAMRGVLRAIGPLALIHGAALVLGAALFVGLQSLPPFSGVGILFYRGVAALAVTGVLLVVLLGAGQARLPASFGLGARDAVSGALVSTSLMFAAFVLGPVTADRSISIFVLSRFEASGRPLSAEDARRAFVGVYVEDWDQIGRRLREQEVSGNLIRTDAGWRLTPQGHEVMASARLMSKVFGGDPRLVGR